MMRAFLAVLLLASTFPGLAAGAEGERSVFPAKAGRETATLVIYAATDAEALRPLILDFQDLHPETAVEITDFVTNDLYREADRACAGATTSADILISSSVDHAVRLANDGCAQSHRSQYTASLEPWANWRDEVFGFTLEPIVFVVNRRKMPHDDIPRSHEALADLLRREPAKYHGRVGTYDIGMSGIGYLLAFHDARQAPTTYGRLIESLSRADPVIRCCNNEVLAELANGDVLIAYNILGSYAYAAARSNPDLEIVLPGDYTLILSRAALIPSRAPRPELGKEFLDYLLSERGRRVARREAYFYGAHQAGQEGAPDADRLIRSGIGRPIRIGPALLATQDEIQRARFIEHWRRLVGAGAR